jgi:hypothetical protein
MFSLKLSETASFDVSQPAGGFQTQLQSTKMHDKKVFAKEQYA